MFKPEIKKLSEQILDKAIKQNVKIITAESCTGGLLAAALTETSGSSKYFLGGMVTYSNQMKIKCLNVKEKEINTLGAVSEKIALAMAKGALEYCQNPSLAIAITGIAGPKTDESLKPVGLVFFAVSCNYKDNNKIYKSQFNLKTREEIREESIIFALKMINENI